MESHDTEEWKERIEDDECFQKEFTLLLKELKTHTINNIDYFKDSYNEKSERIGAAFRILIDHLERGVEPNIERLILVSHQCDYDPSLPANGYRSFVKIVRKCCFKILQLARYISANRESLLFRGGFYGRELTAYVTTLGQLRACMFYLNKLRLYCATGGLFPDEDAMKKEDFEQAESLLLDVESLCQECFYGRCLGFQYCESMTRPLMGICLFMASFSDGYLSESSSTVMRVANSFVGGGRYFIDPELRGEKIVEVTRNCDINFCKAFWAMNENDVMHTLPLFVCPPVEIDRVITLPPEPIDMQIMANDDIITINPPSSHKPIGPVSCRLISYELREGQENWKSHGAKPTHSNPTKVLPRAKGLIIHIHGGGFVAQSSASHEVYLRHWAKQLHTPILSIDYALAPDSPFPRGLEECFYAYCWAVRNCLTLGSTGERIAICGDSAGGNLSVAVAMKAASYGVRVPDGIQTTYACLMVRYSPSPSRMLSLMDPLLPMGIISRCLAAYAGMTAETGVNEPMRSSITKQTLYEFEGKSASSVENLTFESIATGGSKKAKTLPVVVHFKAGNKCADEEDEEDLTQLSSHFQAKSSITQSSDDHVPEALSVINDSKKVELTTSNDSGFVDIEKTGSDKLTEGATGVNMSTLDSTDKDTNMESPTLTELPISPDEAEQVESSLEDQNLAAESSSETSTNLSTRLENSSADSSTGNNVENEEESSLKDNKLPSETASGRPARPPRPSRPARPENGPAVSCLKDQSLASESSTKRPPARPEYSPAVSSNAQKSVGAGNSMNPMENTNEQSTTNVDSTIQSNPTPQPATKTNMKQKLGLNFSSAAKLKKTLGQKISSVEKKLTNVYSEHRRQNTNGSQRGNNNTGAESASASPTEYYTPASSLEDLSYAKIRHYAQSPTMQFKDMSDEFRKNPYMSPILAKDELLLGLPPIYFVCCHLDPMLDDSITLARRLRDLGKEVYLDVLEELPHGFLNLILISKEAKEGSDLCVKRLREILEDPELENEDDYDDEYLEINRDVNLIDLENEVPCEDDLI